MRMFWAVVAILLASPALAHGPTPIKVDESIVIAADPKAIWAVAGKFDSIANWHPDVVSVKAKGGDAIGAEREITLAQGRRAERGIGRNEPSSFKYSYRMSDPNLDALPVSSYSATFVITPTASGGSEVHWYGRFIGATLAMNRPII